MTKSQQHNRFVQRTKCAVHGDRHRGYSEKMACARSKALGISFPVALEQVQRKDFNPYTEGVF